MDDQLLTGMNCHFAIAMYNIFFNYTFLEVSCSDPHDFELALLGMTSPELQ